jgi:hypothetical protein
MTFTCYPVPRPAVTLAALDPWDEDLDVLRFHVFSLCQLQSRHVSEFNVFNVAKEVFSQIYDHVTTEVYVDFFPFSFRSRVET